jgi:rhamnosyl/mannosyltransferase
MYYSKPVINTNLPTGVPYVSIDGETGLTVEAGNLEALSKAILSLTKNDNLRTRLGENAARRVREHFDNRIMLNTLYAHYKELLEN